MRSRRDRGRPQPVRLEAGAPAGAVARGRVRALARAHRRRGRRAGRRHRGQPRLRLWWDRRRLREAALDVPLRRRGDGRGRARVRLALVPAAPRAAEGRRAAAALAAAAAGRRRAALAAARARRRVHGGRGGRARRALRRRSPTASTSCVTHTPPRGHGDLTAVGDRVGSTALLAAIERVQPPLAVFGHIHEGRGEPTRAGRTLCANSAICDRWFERRNQPWLVDIDLAAAPARARQPEM